ncbi:MAG: DUF4058 family protein [Gemmataceae bacterium]
MPLRDHFHPPFAKTSIWESLHAGWPMVIVQHLIKKLPPRYVANLRVHVGAAMEIDIGTQDTQTNGAPPSVSGDNGEGGVATAVWAPARPTLAVAVSLRAADEYEVNVYDTERGWLLVAAVEIVSPSNKDRPESRRLFAAKCAALLQQRVSVSIVDLVTVPEFNLYAELLPLFGVSDPALAPPPPIYAVSCRWQGNAAGSLFQAWYHPLTLGGALPTLPLWLTSDHAIPLELEASYEQTCRDLRIA